MINNYEKLDKKEHIVFANDKNTLITVNNDQKNNVEPIILRKTIKNYIQEDKNDDDDDDDNAESIKLFKKREINMQIKRNFSNNENFKIKIDNNEQKKCFIAKNNNFDDAMDVDDDKTISVDEVVHSPIQGYRLLVSNLHHNVTEDDVLVCFWYLCPPPPPTTKR